MEPTILKEKLKTIKNILNFKELVEKTRKLQVFTNSVDFWQDQKKATNIQKEVIELEKKIRSILALEQLINEYTEFFEIMNKDPLELKNLQVEYDKLNEQIKQLEIDSIFTAPDDCANAILTINAGQGGIDSQDFSQMLLKMYTKYAQIRNYTIKLTDIVVGDEAGIKNATILISGNYAYGYLKAEIGVHRLVRVSPFDSNSRRHTSFASVWVCPEIDESINVIIKSDDMRIDTYRAGGAGGQHINKTDSAVRITHLPTNVVVSCQAERSQTKNKVTALKLLRSKLHALETNKRSTIRNLIEAAKPEASFGSQIRNYVLTPYQIVKDLRTNTETGNVESVLNGNIHLFIESYLLKKGLTKDSFK